MVQRIFNFNLYSQTKVWFLDTSVNNLLSLKYKIQSLDWVHSVITLLDIPLLNSSDAPLARKTYKTLKLSKMKILIEREVLMKYLSSPVFRNFVISEDGKTSGIIVNIKKNEELKILKINQKKKLKLYKDNIKKQNHQNILEIRDVIKSYR